ncbi:hypothetical protein MBLNU13_g09701t1 [Cladosporium sp. NU13]
MSQVHRIDRELQAAAEPTNDQTDSALYNPPTNKDPNKRPLTTLPPKSQPPPSQPSLITILSNSSLHPITLLTTKSRLFATLSHDPSIFSSSTLALNIDHDAFAVFARWLQGGKIHVPDGDDHGFATDLYLLMRAHAAGEALGAAMFADMMSQRSLDSSAADTRAKTHDLEILLQAAAAIWPPGSLGRDLLVDWYVHSAAYKLRALSVEAVVEIGDLDLAVRCMVLGKERRMACEKGEVVRASYFGGSV